MDTLFWDVDTQHDFIDEDGALYVDGAETIRGNLDRITKYARKNDRTIMGSVDYHHEDDEELSDNPDFEDTFPPHCLAGNEGQEKIEETSPANPLWIDYEPRDEESLLEEIHSHEGEVFFRKKRFDVFSNPNVKPVLDAIDPFQIAVYGVTLDVCVTFAVEGLLDMDQQITVISDATRALDENERQSILFDWKILGVQVIDTEEALSGYVL
ncbi:MAG: cysteine hydrolase family protein [bacterium]